METFLCLSALGRAAGMFCTGASPLALVAVGAWRTIRQCLGRVCGRNGLRENVRGVMLPIPCPFRLEERGRACRKA